MLIVAARILPHQQRKAGGRLPDLVGTVLLVAGIGALTLGVSKGASWHWADPRTLSCLIGGFLAVALAVWRSTRHAVPAMETELWGNRTFLVANVVSLLYGMAQYPWLLGTVLFITGLWRYSELRAGLAMTPGALAASAAALLVARLTTSRLRGPRPAALIGLLAFLAGGIWIVPAMSEHPSYLTLILPISLIAGGGMGLITYGTSMAAALSAPPTRFAGATGMNTMARQFGGALGVAALAVILQSDTAQGIDGYRQVYLFCTVLVFVALVLRAVVSVEPHPAHGFGQLAAPLPMGVGGGVDETGAAPPASPKSLMRGIPRRGRGARRGRKALFGFAWAVAAPLLGSRLLTGKVAPDRLAGMVACSVACALAAVDVQDLSSDERGVLEVDDRLDDVVDLTHPA
jgi:hypothetical protein